MNNTSRYRSQTVTVRELGFDPTLNFSGANQEHGLSQPMIFRDYDHPHQISYTSAYRGERERERKGLSEDQGGEDSEYWRPTSPQFLNDTISARRSLSTLHSNYTYQHSTQQSHLEAAGEMSSRFPSTSGEKTEGSYRPGVDSELRSDAVIGRQAFEESNSRTHGSYSFLPSPINPPSSTSFSRSPTTTYSPPSPSLLEQVTSPGPRYGRSPSQGYTPSHPTPRFLLPPPPSLLYYSISQPTLTQTHLSWQRTESHESERGWSEQTHESRVETG